MDRFGLPRFGLPQPTTWPKTVSVYPDRFGLPRFGLPQTTVLELISSSFLVFQMYLFSSQHILFLFWSNYGFNALIYVIYRCIWEEKQLIMLLQKKQLENLFR